MASTMPFRCTHLGLSKMYHTSIECFREVEIFAIFLFTATQVLGAKANIRLLLVQVKKK